MQSDIPAHSSAPEELERLRAYVLNLEEERDYTTTALRECASLAMLTSDISIALIQDSTLRESLQLCVQALVTHLGAAFARVWTFNKETQTLELQASAGLYTHIDGAHSRVPLGMFKIGLIAAERLPHLTNNVIGDPRVSDQEWAQREKMISFAGYPLLIAGELVGVVALFARTSLSPAVLDTLASISNAIALGIERKRIEEERIHLLLVEQQATMRVEAERFRLERILDNLTDGFMIFDEEWRYRYINSQATPYTGKPWQELLGKNVWEEFPELVGSVYYQQYHHAMLHQEPVAFEIFSAPLSGWFDIHAYPIPGGVAVYFRNITERKQAEEERLRLLDITRTAQREAEEALQARNIFLSNISHDLKTPLAVIRGNMQLIQRRIKRGNLLDPSWLTDRLVGMETSTTKMNAMVGDLLDLATLQAGQTLDLDMRPIPLIPLLQQVSAEQQMTTREHQIVVEVSTEDAVVEGDRIRLDRVLTNLLGNAIKYSPNGGKIKVALAQEEVQDQSWVLLSIQDQGVGIPATDQPYIFEPFYRASNVTEHMQGTGVGLASVAQVLRQHGGSISVDSKEGEGSIFQIRLPHIKREPIRHAP